MNCYVNLNNLLVFRNLLEDPVIMALKKPKEVFLPELYATMIEKAEKYGLMGIIPVEYIMYAISHQQNTFNTIAEKHNGYVGEGLKKATAADIILLRGFILEVFNRFKLHPLLGNYIPSQIKPIAGRKILEKCFMDYGVDSSGMSAVEQLCEYYSKFGYGIMADFVAFNWDGEHLSLQGVSNYSTMTFDSIVGYERQKKILIKNTEAFLKNKPANNVLLFGDRGTGKSSSIKAIGNYFYEDGLRMVQVGREHFVQLPLVMSALSKWGKKFIIVLDDLSFEEFEIEYKALKSILDGGLEVKPPNVLFYASSNRRNIIKEVWQDQNMAELHSKDSINEKISLADRFGIKLFYDSMGQDEYYALLKDLANKESLDVSEEDLLAEALKWEMSHTGRNGRIARQLLDYLHGK
ncbi:MAG TPA: ATP-binding protein [Candidatus Avacidaminococcus intestinavium]|uniref:ATP-binding protein n=1 Tax=Candidatus Avacidaminococcus intestinavium TaxID=2840684 RepID=A0A9D1MQ25_9FIRM|nr:ATP-binding protein [Candidatus Avacidaminococcus intestinavium]